LRTHTRIRLVYLPPYQPGLNAQERVWRQVRYEATTNRWFESLDLIWETVQCTTQSWTKVKLKRLCKLTSLSKGLSPRLQAGRFITPD
jgi:transposase